MLDVFPFLFSLGKICWITLVPSPKPVSLQVWQRPIKELGKYRNVINFVKKLKKKCTNYWNKAAKMIIWRLASSTLLWNFSIAPFCHNSTNTKKPFKHANQPYPSWERQSASSTTSQKNRKSHSTLKLMNKVSCFPEKYMDLQARSSQLWANSWFKMLKQGNPKVHPSTSGKKTLRKMSSNWKNHFSLRTIQILEDQYLEWTNKLIGWISSTLARLWEWAK